MVVDATALATFNGEQPPELGAPEPPRVPWLNEDGSPKYGLKGDGSPRRSPAGPGRPRKDASEQPRTTEAPPPGTPATGPRDYTEDLQSAGTAIWVGLSSMPWTRAHARLWVSQVPGLAAGLNAGAQHNPAVRRRVEKIAGEGSVLWVLPLATSVASLAAGSWQLLQNAQLRDQLAAANDQAFSAFVEQQARAMGLDPDPGPTTPGSETPSDSEATVCEDPSHDQYGHTGCPECQAASSTSPGSSEMYSPVV
jgi:hypothetical protein